MSGVERKKPTPRATSAQLEAKRAEAVRLRVEGFTVVAIGKALGVSPQRAGQLLKPVPPNLCRACGGQIERQHQYHPQCRPSRRQTTGRPPEPRPGTLVERQYGLWTVLGYAAAGKWRCRCRCGVERLVDGRSLRGGGTRGCRACRAKERRAKEAVVNQEPSC